MSKEISFVGDIAISTYTGAVYVGLDDVQQLQNLPDNDTATTTEWANWGVDNLEPTRMADDIENSGVLSASISSKTRMAIGKGIEPFLLVGSDIDGNEILLPVRDEEITSWMRANKTYKYSYKTIYNLLSYGWSATQFVFNKAVLVSGKKGIKINRVFAADAYDSRISKKNENNEIEYLYRCSKWNGVNSYDPEKMFKIPLLKEDYEIDQLKQFIESKSKEKEFAMLHRLTLNGKHYYPDPLWKSAKEWVKISRSIPNIKKAINKNQMLIKYVITINNAYWSKVPGWSNKTQDEQIAFQKDKFKEIDTWLTGEENAGKSISSSNYYDPISKEWVNDIKIEVVEDKFKDGKMLPDSAAADKQILFAQFFNPAIWGGNLLGDGASGGAGSGSDIREAFLVLLMLMHTERQMNLEVFDIVAAFNGWTERLEVATQYKDPKTGETSTIIPQLVFRYKSGLLTTLDTGKSTKEATV